MAQQEERAARARFLSRGVGEEEEERLFPQIAEYGQTEGDIVVVILNRSESLSAPP